MPSSSSPTTHDYTEGASAIDIKNVIETNRRSRRDSRYDEGEGNVFDGPGHLVNPSSVSRMSLSEHGRRSSEGRLRGSQSRRRSEDGGARPGSRSRRMSTDSGSSYRSRGASEVAASDDEDEGRHGMLRRSRRKSTSPAPRPTVFENIAQMFGRAPNTTESPPHSRRASLSSRHSRSGLLRRTSSRRSDAGSDYAIETDDERWGYASSEEDDSDLESDGERPNRDTDSIDFRSINEESFPPSPGLALHMMSGDPIFGDEARIDMGQLDLTDPPPPGPPSRQLIFIEDEDAHIRFVGYETVLFRQFLWRACCVLSFGILGLLGHWFPRLWLRWVTKEKAFVDMERGFIVIEVGFHQFDSNISRDNEEVCLQRYCLVPHTQA